MEVVYNVSTPPSHLNHDPLDALDRLHEINHIEVKALLPVIIFFAAILTIGLIGNILVLVVYTFRYKRSPARQYILFLAVIDCGMCSIGMVYHVYDLMNPYTFTHTIACKTLTFIVTSLFLMSVFELIVIAFDRYMKVCRPISSLQISHVGQRRACTLAAFLGLLFSWPNLVLYGPSEMETPDGNYTGISCYIQTHLLETSYPSIYMTLVLVICAACTVCLVVMYSLICHQIYKRYKTSWRSPGHCQEETNLTDTSLRSFKESLRILNKTNDSYLKGQNEKSSEDNRTSKSGSVNLAEHASSDCEIGIKIAKVDCHGSSTEDVIRVSVCNSTLERRQVLPSVVNNRPESPDVNKDHTNQNTNNDSFIEGHCLQNTSACNTFNGASNKGLMQTDCLVEDEDAGCKHVSETTCSRCKDSSLMSDDKEQSRVSRSDCTMIPDLESATYRSEPRLLHKTEEIVEENDRRLSATKLLEGPGLTNNLRKCSSENQIKDSIKQMPTYRSSQTLLTRETSERRTNRSFSCSQRTQPLKITSTKHSKITKIMLTITLVFVVSYCPCLFLSIWSFQFPDFWDNLTMAETAVCELLLRFYLVNNVVNPFIYSFWDVRFQREIRDLTKSLINRIKCT